MIALRVLLLVLGLGLPLMGQVGRLEPSKPTLLQGMAPDMADLDMRRTPIVRAVEMAADSVVSIYVQDTAGRSRSSSIEGQGSGVIIDETGLVITNWHVIASVDINPNGRELAVKLKNSKSYRARLLSSSREHDLALLQLDLPAEEVVKPLQSSDSDTLMVGETVIAIGNPQGHANTVTVGVLSAVDRAINVRTPDRQVRRYRGLLQTDAAINQGNSGGALLDITGRLIGINNAMAMGAENIGFAIPVNTVRRVFEDVLLSSENLTSIWLGMQVKDMGQYALVTELTPSGPAAREGVRRG
ncbi:MAG: S1C family serine protease, partial [Planctomycetota bacterium]